MNIPIEQVRSCRAELAAKLADAKHYYDQLEANLHELDRQMCAMQGGLQAYDELLKQDTVAANGHELHSGPLV